MGISGRAQSHQDSRGWTGKMVRARWYSQENTATRSARGTTTAVTDVVCLIVRYVGTLLRVVEA